MEMNLFLATDIVFLDKDVPNCIFLVLEMVELIPFG